MLSLPAAAVSVTQAESNQNCSQHRAQRQRQHLGRYAGEGSKIAIITIRERNEDTEQSNTFPVLLLLLLLLFVCFQYINSFTLSHSKVMTRSHVIQKEKKKNCTRSHSSRHRSAGIQRAPTQGTLTFQKKKKES